MFILTLKDVLFFSKVRYWLRYAVISGEKRLFEKSLRKAIFCKFIKLKFMIDYIKGQITELTPANVVLETAGVGYFINISLTTYTALNAKTGSSVVRLWGYSRRCLPAFRVYEQRWTATVFVVDFSFRIKANTARVIASSYTASEIQQMIAGGDVVSLNAIKGIGINRPANHSGFEG